MPPSMTRSPTYMFGVYIREHSPAHSVEECRVFPDVHTVTTSSKEKVTSKTAPKAAQTVEGIPAGATGDLNIPAEPTTTIMDCRVKQKYHVMFCATENGKSYRIS